MKTKVLKKNESKNLEFAKLSHDELNALQGGGSFMVVRRNDGSIVFVFVP
jgi:hypothetical protein